MRRHATIALLGLALSAAAGCYSQTLVVSGTTPQLEPAERQWRHHLFNGVVTLSGDIDLREACPQGISRIESSMTLLNGALWLVTGTIYAPTTTWVYCQLPEPGAAAGVAPAGSRPDAAAPQSPPTDVPVIDQDSLGPDTGG